MNPQINRESSTSERFSRSLTESRNSKGKSKIKVQPTFHAQVQNLNENQKNKLIESNSYGFFADSKNFTPLTIINNLLGITIFVVYAFYAQNLYETTYKDVYDGEATISQWLIFYLTYNGPLVISMSWNCCFFIEFFLIPKHFLMKLIRLMSYVLLSVMIIYNMVYNGSISSVGTNLSMGVISIIISWIIILCYKPEMKGILFSISI